MANVLIIEDDLTVRSLVRRMLTFGGHEVVEAEDGREALRSVQARAPDLVITDLMMPDMDGIEVITEFRRLGVDVPVIAISGGGLMPKELLLSNASALGAVEVVPKPFDMHQLLDAVERVLGVLQG